MRPEILEPLLLSMKVSLLATGIDVLLAVPLARILARRTFPGASLLHTLFLLPMVLPPTVLGYLLLLLVSKKGPVGAPLYHAFGVELVFQWTGALLAASVVAFPLLYQGALAAFRSVDPRYEAVARTLGRGPLYVFFTITLPLAWPQLLAGVALAFARALGDFGTTLMLAGYIPGRTVTLPLGIYFAVANGENDVAAVMTGLLFTFSIATLLGIQWLTRRQGTPFLSTG
ncbi:molybdate ABC transporter permease subunit [Brockia lithotrophica]|uniref:Molybdenum transport system permease n=1 Tax=Brockia lithotrophica TaxID=933949 RepID=A0A660L4N9_9BACL|nr:molybdate ABC transporter permease subunit [Brockia lithotrophica]RKQ88907.1 molybdate transport system permease protein [Brockia lithotrophica]